MDIRIGQRLFRWQMKEDLQSFVDLLSRVMDVVGTEKYFVIDNASKDKT